MSRRRRSAIFAAFLLVIAVLIWLDHSPVRRRFQPQPKSEEQAKSLDFEKYHAKTFTVINVVDGDTIDINIPDGNKEYTRIRLWGIDTPETKSPKKGVSNLGLQAADFTAKLALGKSVTVYLDKNCTRGYYGRLLAYAQLPDGKFLNEVLLTEGFATARTQRKGLWQNVTRRQLPEWLQKKKPKLLNK